jgi:exopolysaccharide biosynthesis polyprenyl glycosylphosphotransferase
MRFSLLEYYATYSQAFYIRLGIIAVCTWPLVFAVYKLYQPDYLFGGSKEYGSVVNACTMGLAALILYSFLDRGNQHDISRGWLVIVWFLSIGTVWLVRFLYRRVIYHLRQRGRFVRKALIVGVNHEGEQVASQLRDSPAAGVELVGFVDAEHAPGSDINGIPVLGDFGSLRTLIAQLGIEELIVIPTALSRDGLLGIYRDWGTDSHVQIRLSSGLYELFTTGVQVKEVGFVPLVSLDRTRITGIDALTKMIVDYVIGSLAIFLLWPAFLSIAFLIRRDSPGPAIYRRRVVGLGGRAFDAYKFRTMIVDAENLLESDSQLKAEWEETGKIQNDPRVTRIGEVLRRYSLDELPQLFNVLRGEMSLVGPRMLTPGELRHFGHWRHNLLTVKPGLTGLWQVSGRSDLSYEERVRLDMQYIRNHTMWLDLKLLVTTVTTVLSGKGAY